MKNPLVREAVFPARTECLDDVLRMIESMLDDAGCPADVIMSVAVAAEEIFVNIAHYAYGDGDGEAAISCELKSDPHEITVRFSDRGKPFNPLDRDDPDIMLDAESRGIGGLGIYMVKESMDCVTYDYTDGRNNLVIKKAFTPVEQP